MDEIELINKWHLWREKRGGPSSATFTSQQLGLFSCQSFESLWGCDKASGNVSSFYWLEHIWLTHQREWWGFCQSRSQSLRVCIKTQLWKQAPPTPIPAFCEQSERSRVLKNICMFLFFLSGWFVHFTSGLSGLFVPQKKLKGKQNKKQEVKTNKGVRLVHAQSNVISGLL